MWWSFNRRPTRYRVNLRPTRYRVNRHPTRYRVNLHLTRAPHGGIRSGMTETPDSLIPYDEIVQEALRAVVGRVLGQVEAGGGTLPGTHHFYITFKTGAPGVSIPTRLTERFPDEMTIVLQNKFWDLKVTATGFSVGLTFNQVAANLVIPFSAITAFVDPAVDFGLQFQAAHDLDDELPDNAENDSPDTPVDTADDGSNVVTIDFGRKK